MKVSGKVDAPATLLPEKKPPVANEQQGGWVQDLFWILVSKKKSHPSLESNHDSSGIQFLAYSLHQLHYPGTTLKCSLYPSLQPQIKWHFSSWNPWNG
jgi:hypothetical protein